MGKARTHVEEKIFGAIERLPSYNLTVPHKRQRLEGSAEFSAVNFDDGFMRLIRNGFSNQGYWHTEIGLYDINIVSRSIEAVTFTRDLSESENSINISRITDYPKVSLEDYRLDRLYHLSRCVGLIASELRGTDVADLG